MQASTVRVPSIGLLLVAVLLFTRIAGAGDYFPDNAVWNQSIADAQLDPLSNNVIQQLNAAGGWGASNRFRIDYSIEVLQADAAGYPIAPLLFSADEVASGQIALTAQSDRFTVNKWAGLLGPGDLQQLQVTDFEIVAGGTPIEYTGDCGLNPRPLPSNIFGDGFEGITLNP